MPVCTEYLLIPQPYRRCVGVGVVLQKQLTDLDVAAIRSLHQGCQASLESISDYRIPDVKSISYRTLYRTLALCSTLAWYCSSSRTTSVRPCSRIRDEIGVATLGFHGLGIMHMWGKTQAQARYHRVQPARVEKVYWFEKFEKHCTTHSLTGIYSV